MMRVLNFSHFDHRSPKRAYNTIHHNACCIGSVITQVQPSASCARPQSTPLPIYHRPTRTMLCSVPNSHPQHKINTISPPPPNDIYPQIFISTVRQIRAPPYIRQPIHQSDWSPQQISRCLAPASRLAPPSGALSTAHTTSGRSPSTI